jgi:hypothetical protein
MVEVSGRARPSRGKFDRAITNKLTGISLNFLYENMARILLRSRQLLATSILLLLVGVVVLSTATRRPCLHVCSRPWHTYKAGHMAVPEVHKPGKLPLNIDAQRPEHTLNASPLAISPSVPREEASPAGLSIVVQIRCFRSPPPLA